MIVFPERFKQASPAGFDGVFDWDFLEPAFGGTKIMPMDAVDMLPHLEEEAKKRQAEGVKLGGRGHKKENSVVPGTTEFIGRSRDQVARAAGVLHWR